MRPLPLHTRVAAFAAAAVGVSVALAAVAAFVTLRHELRTQVDSSLLQRARAAAATSLGDPGLLTQVPAAALFPTDVRIGIIRADGQLFVALGEPEVPAGGAELAVAAGVRAQSLRTVALAGVPYRVAAVPVPHTDRAMVLARSLQESLQVQRQVTLVLLAVGLVGIAVAASAGLAVARAGLRPVGELTAAAEHVAETEELRPIVQTRPAAPDDEVARLAVAFNAMLAALADSRERQRRLVADAGHELRTPLTSLRTNLDLLAQADAGAGLPAAERAQLLADVRAQAAELTALVADLVELARDPPAAGAPEELELSAVVERAVTRARRRATGLRFAVRSEPWQLAGDPRLLERAVTNLLDNAVKWSPPGATITVSLRDGVLQVADAGPGIPEADLPLVFDRFYRSADARALPGSGLGLAIVRQVIEQHGGTVSASRGPAGGALLTVTLPGRPGDPQPDFTADSESSQVPGQPSRS